MKSASPTVETAIEVSPPQLEIEVLPSKAQFYQSIGAEDAEFLKEKSLDIKRLCKDINTRFELMGEILIEAKKRVGHGNFGVFIKLELQPLYGIGEQTAEDLMRKSNFVKQFPALNKFAPSVLTELSRVSTPQELIQDALRLAEAGENLTVAKVKQQRKEVVPKPKFVKGNIVEFSDGNQYTIGQIESVYTKEGFSYKIKYLHGKPHKGKLSENSLALCPVQTRQNHFDDCFNNPKPGEKVVLAPISSWNQHLSGQTFTVVASVLNGVYLKRDSDSKNRVLVNWAELMPAPPVDPLDQQPPQQQEESGQLAIIPSTSDVTEAIVINVESSIIEDDNEPLLTFKDLEKATDSQLTDLFSKLSLELHQRLDTSVKAQLDALVEKVWEEISELDQRQKEQFLILLIDKSFE